MRLLFALLLFSPTLYAQSYDPNRLYTPQQLREDFQVLHMALEQLHPGLYRYTPRDSMDVAYRQTLSQLTKPMTDAAFGLVVRPYLGLVRCVHTSLNASADRSRYVRRNKFAPFPLSLIHDQGRLYVAPAPKDQPTIKAFDELVAVNGKSVSTLLRQFESQNWADGYITAARRSLTATRFGTWYQAAFGYSDSLTVLVADSSGQLRTETLRFSRKSVKKDQKKAEADTARKQQQTLRSAPLLKKKELSLTLVDDDSTAPTNQLAVLRIDGFENEAMRRQFRRVFRLLRERNVKRLVIDVRGNFGGSAITCRDLLRYVADRPFRFWDSTVAKRRDKGNLPAQVRYGGLFPWLDLKLRVKRDANGLLQQTYYRREVKPYTRRRFTGPVFVLTNSLSFSAAAIFPALARSLNSQVTIVGRETGGGEVSCNAGHSFRVELPNTKYQLMVPYYHIRWNSQQPDRGLGVQPDVPVAVGPATWRSGRDADLDRVKALVRTRSVQ
ncbi:S41 family peptidase [Spirosoma montaniterrae]|nr:S41 family peptidase [Spirosoma montaniterrae]